MTLLYVSVEHWINIQGELRVEETEILNFF